MNPKPFVSLNHFTLPVAISLLLLHARRHVPPWAADIRTSPPRWYRKIAPVSPSKGREDRQDARREEPRSPSSASRTHPRGRRWARFAAPIRWTRSTFLGQCAFRPRAPRPRCPG